MARLPFNPNRVQPDPAASPAKPGTALTVSQASDLIKAALVKAIPGKLKIVGEISNFSDRHHWYFCLKDAGAAISCVCFASAAKKVDFPVADGMEVVASGRIDYYPTQGKLQLYVEALEPVGQGVLELRFRALCNELRKLGYFEEGRKKPLPSFPRRIAVVTSRTGAALQDVINTAGRRWRGCELMLYDVRVQGAAAAPEIAAALEALSKQGAALGLDAIILTRGGGSIEDLWAFNERCVAEAIYRCRLPIVAAIGHETDTTIAELVADRRCSTPTQAAMVSVPDERGLQQQVAQLGQRLGFLLRRQAETSRQRLDAVARHPVFRRPLTMVEPHAARLKALNDRLGAELPRRVRAGQDRLAALTRQLGAVGPKNVLDRGYSYTQGADGRVLRHPDQVRPGEPITSVLAGGTLQSFAVVPASAARVEPAGGKDGDGREPSEPPGGRPPAGAAPAGRSRGGARKRARADAGPGLFSDN